MIRRPLVHDPERLREQPSYMHVPVIMAAAEVCNAASLIDSVDETEAVDRFKLSSLRAALVGIGYEYGMVVGR